MKKILAFTVLGLSLLALGGCGSKITQKDLQKNDWQTVMEEDDTQLTMKTSFTDSTMTMTPELDEMDTEDLGDLGELGEDFAQELLAMMVFEIDYKIDGNKIHLESEDLDLDDDFTMKKDGKNIIFKASDADEDVDELVLEPAK
ncbi:hypothetical protein [Enterococcus timonensis]|uniref:hypothetical protein n=1 Tax=Enterococcus timonensis TaxID=1852364 RepID=UPI0008DA9054|nr:hypothetical protein [Enterococcus timonensis]